MMIFLQVSATRSEVILWLMRVAGTIIYLPFVYALLIYLYKIITEIFFNLFRALDDTLQIICHSCLPFNI